MTETAHQATSQPLPLRGPVKEGSVGRATGVRIRIVDPNGRTCSAGTDGEVWVLGPTSRSWLPRQPGRDGEQLRRRVVPHR